MFGLFRKKPSEMWLLAGLGNPGDKYSKNRHNIGFMAIDAMADGAVSFPPFRSKFQGLLSEARIDDKKVVLLKPLTYMNNSGQSVAAAAKFYKITPDRIVIMHDELDLEPGQVRVKKGGGNAGHNGLKSIQSHLGTPDFWRVRLGIGHPGDKRQVSNYVLSDFAKNDTVWLEALVEAAAEYFSLIIASRMDEYETRLNEHLKKYAKVTGKV